MPVFAWCLKVARDEDSPGETAAAIADGMAGTFNPSTDSRIVSAAASEGYSHHALSIARSALSKIPTTTSGFAAFGAISAGAVTLAQNGAGLIAKAARGEHMSAWQAVKGMLLEPIVAAASGALGGAIGGAGLLASSRLAMVALVATGALTASAANGIADAAVDRQLSRQSTWVSLGISMAQAVAAAMVLAPYMR